jgi:aryl-alcohol dehydrogenase-like predicted oxidoreductase
VGVEASREFVALVETAGPAGATPAQAAIACVWQQPGVTTVIPGARNPDQAQANAATGRIGPLSDAFVHGVRELYDARIRAFVHDRW